MSSPSGRPRPQTPTRRPSRVEQSVSDKTPDLPSPSTQTTKKEKPKGVKLRSEENFRREEPTRFLLTRAKEKTDGFVRPLFYCHFGATKTLRNSRCFVARVDGKVLGSARTLWVPSSKGKMSTLVTPHLSQSLTVFQWTTL